MANKVNGADLKKAGYKEGKILGLALKTAEDIKGISKKEKLALLKKVRDYPEMFMDDQIVEPLARAIVDEANAPRLEPISLKAPNQPYTVFGAGFIEEGAREQMNVAMRLPVAIAGALMPDAHQGYGLPIGGVLATENVVIPYGVGVDIGCRMGLTIYDIKEKDFAKHETSFKRELIAHTIFGAGEGFKGSNRSDHEVLDSVDFGVAPFVAAMRDKAWSQLGTSGGGNHFVEWGIVEFERDDETLNVPAGKYVGLLSHSGSRGFGATIAGHYTKLAKEICRLPKEAMNLAYLELDSDEGQQYWIAMNLAGKYASACHQVIHDKLTRAINATPLARVENHHNFAWKEQWRGKDVIVHRKGATPAGKGTMGIIPGSMTAPGFVVRGRGDESSIQSASHGAGRLMSRTKAVQTFTRDQLRKALHEKNVTLIGAGLDESPMAYKDINMVMNAQQELVDIVARFQPRIVRMAADGSRED